MNDQVTLQMFFDAWELFREPALAGAFAGAGLGLVGVYVVLRRMVFFSAALSQVSGLGIALAFYATIHWGATGWLGSPSVISALATAAAAVLLTVTAQRSRDSNEVLLGLLFLLGSAGMLVVGTRIVEEVRDIDSLLFGTAVAVLPEDFKLIATTSVALILIHLWMWRGFMSITFERDDARVRRIPANLLEFLLLAGVAIAISVTTRVLGALPAFAFSVLPGVAALRLAPNVPWALVLATLFGAAMGFGGYVAAFLYETPVGATQAVLGVLLVVVVSVLRGAWDLSVSTVTSLRERRTSE